jgi:hypothetical protein
VSDNNEISRIANALDRIETALANLVSAPKTAALSPGEAPACHWEAGTGELIPVETVNRVPLDLLLGVGAAKATLLANTRQFARGFGSNNALLWGARGMGKSSLVKAVHAQVAEESAARLVLVEINREDIDTLPRLMRALASLDARFLLFCDDLSFDAGETSYKSLKTILDGGLEGRPPNALFYATSNRRHLMPRDMIENERSTAIIAHESVDEKISLSDRFGLWLGFHNCDQETFLQMVRAYADHYELKVSEEALRAGAIEWAQTRGARSGRVAIQFIRQIAGESGQVV